MLLTGILAALFGLVIILVDLTGIFPAGINVSLPQSLLYYPAVGFLVEILFHVLPLAVLLFLLTAIFKNAGEKKLIWATILIVALLEPVFQTVPGIAPTRYPIWVAVPVGLHIYFINLSQLLVIKHYDFISMNASRLVYYLIWHIGWGYMRLKLLY